MKFRSFLNVLAAIAGGLLVLGTIGFLWVLAQSPLGLLKGSSIAEPTAAMFVPKQAPVMASLLVNPDRLQNLRLLVANPRDRKSARTEFEQFKQGILGSSELDYKRDVQPWLGDEITAAITTLDIDRDPANGKEPGYLLALTTKNTEQSREFLQLFWQKRAIAGTELAFDDYQGTKIIYGKVQNEGVPITLATGVVGTRYVLFANSPKVLRDAINNVQAEELNLTNSSKYQEAIAALDRGRIGVAFLNVPELAALNNQEPPEKNLSAAIAVGLDRRGLVAETAILGASKSATTVKRDRPVEALKYIPAISPISASGQNLDQFWSGLSETQYGKFSQLINQPISTLQNRWKLNLPQDIFKWVKGEYALALVPNDKTLDWVFVADKSVDPGAEAAIAHLDDLAKSQGISSGSINLNDQPISVWTKFGAANQSKIEAEVTGVHTSIGKYEIFATSITAMNAVLNANKNNLVNSKEFGSAISALRNSAGTAPLQKTNNGYLFLDWKKAQPIIESQFPLLKVFELTGQPLFDHLRSLTISNYGNQSGIQRGAAFIQLS